MEDVDAVGAVKAAYGQAWTKYRSDDDIEVTTDNHRRLRGILQGISASFDRPIKVLDVGCGTGRYFHCLKNVEHLTGVDLSPEMLQAAGRPVCGDQVLVGNIELLCANVYEVSFPAESFHFIYSLGMFGFGCPVTVSLCNRLYEWLSPGDILFLNAVDFRSLRLRDQLRKRARRMLVDYFPRSAGRFLGGSEGKVPFCGLLPHELKNILQGSRFSEFEVYTAGRRSPLARADHLECIARKPGHGRGDHEWRRSVAQWRGLDK